MSRNRWLPNQHGAWAMLAVPFLAGTFLGHPRWAHLPLLAAWLLGYLAAYHFQQWLRLSRLTRNPKAPRRHVRPAACFGAGALLFGLPPAALHPWLLPAAACAAPFVLLNSLYAYANRERALWNGLAAVVPACGMLLVTLRLGGGSWDAGLAPALACLLYFSGTVPYVKTMIRERNSRAYYGGSVAYHGVAPALATLLNPWLAAPFALYLLRAALLPGRGLKVGVVGAVEVAASLALLGTVLAVF
ncbi:YwiC-like family protein [Streptomyces violascens]|uniref:Membrane protein n=1 Tax=Streptomyces violascens TaxID=67381 RepID=A0ABQ3R0P7_9ACTN|nr:YwiC-like family protein [Streptomyces violascens]GGU08296.1 membrane protein [Streptomyces violascens]GHI43083.1 membrane protein [Streptomyces violascens]